MNTYVFCEEDGTNSVIVHCTGFFKTPQFEDVAAKLFAITNFRGGDKDTDLWMPPRLQRWHHLQNYAFHAKWPPTIERWQPVPYEPWLLHFQTQVQLSLSPLFAEMHVKQFAKIPLINSALINLYRDSRDRIHLHQDTSDSFGVDPTIVCASFGSTRALNFVRLVKAEKELDFSVLCEDGDLVIMAGASQRYFAHEIRAQEAACGQRISVTFREHNQH
jgi:alkylated DNA repair dioxygenase AlkB